MNNCNCPGTRAWKWLGFGALLLAGYAFVRMYPDLKRYIKIESM